MCAAGAAPVALQQGASTILSGVAPLVRCFIQTDRQRVLTQALDGTIAQWDVTLGTVVHTYPAGSDFAALEQELFRPANVPSWFSADCKLGSLAIHLDTPSAFSAGAGPAFRMLAGMTCLHMLLPAHCGGSSSSRSASAPSCQGQASRWGRNLFSCKHL